MKKQHTLITGITVLLLMLFAMPASAETLDDIINSLIVPRQQYNTMLNDAAFNSNNQSEEQINPQTGEFTYRHTDYSLPGKNGLDVNITRIYKSGQVKRFQTYKSGSADQVIDAYSDSNFLSFYEKRYYLGAGVRFSFPTIEVMGSSTQQYIYLHDESGAVHRLIGPENGVYKLEGRKLDDVKVTIDNSNPPSYSDAWGSSQYILEEKDGKKTYFSGGSAEYEGRILAIVDRYGNSIRFEYSEIVYRNKIYSTDNNKTFCLITKIIDTADREINITYNKVDYYNIGEDGYNLDLEHNFDVVITMPDGTGIVYNKNSMLSAIISPSPNNAYWTSGRQHLSGVSVNGQSKYFYWYEHPIYASRYGSGDYITNNNNWEILNFIGYGETQKATTLEYSFSEKKLGDDGRMRYPKVKYKEDIISDSYNHDDWDSQTVSCINKQVVRSEEYGYVGDAYGIGDIAYPMLNFEDGNDINYFNDNYSYYQGSYQAEWERSKDAAKDGFYGLTSKAAASASSVKLHVKLNSAGSMCFDAKATTAGKALYVAASTSEPPPSEMDSINVTTDWGNFKYDLNVGEYDIYLRCGEGSGSVYLDNIVIGETYTSDMTVFWNDDSYTSIVYQYSPDNSLTGILTSGPDGGTEEQREYDERSMLKAIKLTRTDVINGLWDPPVITEKSYVYDNYGNLEEYQGPEFKNAIVKYEYAKDKYHRLKDRSVYAFENEVEGDLLSKTSYTVNGYGNTVKEIRYDWNDGSSYEDGVQAITDFYYENPSNPGVVTKKHSYLSTADPQHFITNYEYGALTGYTEGGLYLTREYSGDAGAPIYEKEYDYNFSNGFKTSEIIYHNNNQASTTTYIPDDQYRVHIVNYPDGTTKTYNYYDGGKDINGTYDRNYIIEVETNAPQEATPTPGAGTPNQKLLYAYDIFGKLLKVCDASDNYRVLREYAYDPRGNLITEIDGNENQTLCQYDSLNRLIAKQYCGEGTPQTEITVSYLDKTDMLSLFFEDAVQSTTVTDEDGWSTTYYMDAAQHIVGIETPFDGSDTYLTKYEYDSLGNKASITDAMGNKTGFTYDKLGRLTGKGDALHNTTSFAYNAADKLTQKTEPDGKTTQYEYDTAGRLDIEKVGTSDSIGTKHTYTDYDYDLANNVIEFEKGQREAGNETVSEKTRYTFNSMNRLEYKADYMEVNDSYCYTEYEYYPDGYVWHERVNSQPYFDGEGTKGATSIITENTYDSLGRKKKEITTATIDGDNRGIVKKEYDYDDNNNLKVMREYDSENTFLTTEYQYDYRNRLVNKKEPIGEIGTTAQRVTDYCYDGRGNLTAKQLEQVRDGFVNVLTESYTYDGCGNMLSKTNALGEVTKYAYDGNNNKIAEIDGRHSSCEPVIDAPGIRYGYDALNRQTTKSIYNGAGAETVIEKKEYDGRGNVAKITDGELEHNGKGITMTYNAQDLMATYTLGSAKEADDDFVGREMTYDGSGRLLTQIDYDKNEDDVTESYTTRYEYCLNGMLKKKIFLPDALDPEAEIKETYEYDGSGKFYMKKTDPNGGVTEIFKDLFGHPYKTKYPDGTTETVDYNWYLGLAVVLTDRKGRKTRNKYDRAKNLVQTDVWYDSNKENGTDFDYWKTTLYTYDDWNNLLTSEGHRTKTNQTTGELVEDNSLGNLVTYTYDDLFRVKTVSGPNGRETQTQYDEAGNVSEKRYKVTDAYYDITRYTYDEIGRLGTQTVLVEAAHLKDQGSSLPSDGEYPNRKKLQTTYTYHNSYNVETKTDPLGFVTKYSYNPDGKLTEVKVQYDADTSINTSYEYDCRGNLKKETNGIGDYTAYTYDGMNRMKTKIQSGMTGKEAKWVWDYDEVGNVVHESTPGMDYANGEYYTYGYDNMNRRTSTKNILGELTEAVKYDAADNVKKRVDGRNCTDEADIESALGDSFTYDAFGHVLTKTDARLKTTSYQYDLLGNLTYQEDANGWGTSYQYNTDNTLKQVDYPDGGHITYDYDKKGRLTRQSVKQSTSVTCVTEYAYTAFDKVYSETDPDSKTAYYVYDANGNVAEATDRRGNTTLFDYHRNNSLALKQTPLETDGGVTTYITESYDYDAAGNLKKKTLEGDANTPARETYYDYYPGSNGLLKTMRTNAGQEVEYTYTDANLVESVNTLRSDGAGSETYDTIEYRYDAYGRMTDEIKYVTEGYYADNGNPVTELRTRYTYNLLGMKESVSTPKHVAQTYEGQYTTGYDYDSLNRLASINRSYDGGEEPWTYITQYTYDAVGNVETVTDESGYTTSYAYDEMNRVQTVTNAQYPTEPEAEYGYDFTGNKTTEKRPNGTWTYTYNSRGLPELTIAPKPDGTAGGKVVQCNSYDENGNLKTTMDEGGYAANPKYGTTYTYNAANLVTGMTDAEGHETSYTYNCMGERTSVTDATGRATQYTYNLMGKAETVTNGEGEATAYEYDSMGNQTKMTDGNGKETHYAYGPFGVLLGVTDARGRAQSYSYDMDGNLLKAVSKGGAETVYTYDNRGNVKSRSTGGQTIRYSCDVMGNRTGMTDQTGTYTYEYDNLYRPDRVKKDGAIQVAYTYDRAGNITQKSYQGYTFTYAYDSRDRLTGVSGGGVSCGYGYDPDTGNLASVTNSSGVSAAYQYNRNNAVTKITNTAGSGAAVWDYTYDGAGRVETVTTTGATTTYAYDGAGRVETVAMPGKTTDYAYDDAGNRAAMTEEWASAKEHQDAVTGQTVSYNGKTTYYAYSDANELETTTAVMYNEGVERLRLVTTNSYDTDGRLYSAVTASVYAGELQSGLAVTDSANAAVDMTQNSYDVWGNLTAVTVTKGSETSRTEYSYNGDGLRTARTVTGVDSVVKTTNYLLDGAYVVGETDGAGAVTATYVRGMGYIAKIGAASGVSYYQYNAHGDVVAVASGTDGHVQNRYEYDIFGMEILQGVEEVENSIRYAGEFYDASAGLYYLRARYYDPATARFTSEDTYRGDATDPASLNLYTYCGNDPVNYTDPSGHSPGVDPNNTDQTLAMPDIDEPLPYFEPAPWVYNPADYGGHPGLDILPGESPWVYNPADYGGHPGLDILPGETRPKKRTPLLPETDDENNIMYDEVDPGFGALVASGVLDTGQKQSDYLVSMAYKRGYITKEQFNAYVRQRGGLSAMDVKVLEMGGVGGGGQELFINGNQMETWGDGWGSLRPFVDVITKGASGLNPAYVRFEFVKELGTDYSDVSSVWSEEYCIPTLVIGKKGETKTIMRFVFDNKSMNNNWGNVTLNVVRSNDYKNYQLVDGLYETPISAFTYDNSGGAIQIDYKSIAGYIGKYYKTVNLEYRTVDGGMSSGSGQVSGEGVWPVGGNGGTLTAIQPGYSGSGNPHYGIDIGADFNTPILAAFEGTVVQKNYQENGFGYYVVIQMPTGEYVTYAHMNQASSVNIGDRVKAGQQIGLVGSTGNSSGPHLHFQISSELNKKNPTALNVLSYLNVKDVVDHGGKSIISKTLNKKEQIIGKYDSSSRQKVREYFDWLQTYYNGL